MTVRVRAQDRALAESILENAQKRYHEGTGETCKLEIDNEVNLPSDTCGGVELLTKGGRIKILNTLEARLDLISEQLIPEIRTALFGRNVNRRFAD